MLDQQLDVADHIRGKQVPTKTAVATLRKRLLHKNPNVQLLTLSLLDICVKNSGQHFNAELAHPDAMRDLQSVLNNPAVTLEVRNKTLELIQFCGVAFQGKPELQAAVRLYEDLRVAGVQFPDARGVKGATAMIEASAVRHLKLSIAYLFCI